MRNKLGIQPVDNGKKVNMKMIMVTLWDIIGSSQNNVENKEIYKEVKNIQNRETKNAIAKLEERMLQSYKKGELNIKKGTKVKKAEIRNNIIKKASKEENGREER